MVRQIFTLQFPCLFTDNSINLSSTTTNGDRSRHARHLCNCFTAVQHEACFTVTTKHPGADASLLHALAVSLSNLGLVEKFKVHNAMQVVLYSVLFCIVYIIHHCNY